MGFEEFNHFYFMGNLRDLKQKKSTLPETNIAHENRPWKRRYQNILRNIYMISIDDSAIHWLSTQMVRSWSKAWSYETSHRFKLENIRRFLACSMYIFKEFGKISLPLKTDIYRAIYKYTLPWQRHRFTILRIYGTMTTMIYSLLSHLEELSKALNLFITIVQIVSQTCELLQNSKKTWKTTRIFTAETLVFVVYSILFYNLGCT